MADECKQQNEVDTLQNDNHVTEQDQSRSETEAPPECTPSLNNEGDNAIKEAFERRAPVICRPLGRSRRSVMFIPVCKKAQGTTKGSSRSNLPWVKRPKGQGITEVGLGAASEIKERDGALQHRIYERMRHKQTNLLINQCHDKVPLDEDDPKDSKVMLLQRVVAYFCFLETQVEELSLSLGMHPMINQISDVSHSINDIVEMVGCDLEQNSALSDHNPVELLNAYLDLMGKPTVQISPLTQNSGYAQQSCEEPQTAQNSGYAQQNRVEPETKQNSGYAQQSCEEPQTAQNSGYAQQNRVEPETKQNSGYAQQSRVEPETTQNSGYAQQCRVEPETTHKEEENRRGETRRQTDIKSAEEYHVVPTMEKPVTIPPSSKKRTEISKKNLEEREQKGKNSKKNPHQRILKPADSKNLLLENGAHNLSLDMINSVTDRCLKEACMNMDCSCVLNDLLLGDLTF